MPVPVHEPTGNARGSESRRESGEMERQRSEGCSRGGCNGKGTGVGGERGQDGTEIISSHSCVVGCMLRVECNWKVCVKERIHVCEGAHVCV